MPCLQWKFSSNNSSQHVYDVLSLKVSQAMPSHLIMLRNGSCFFSCCYIYVNVGMLLNSTAPEVIRTSIIHDDLDTSDMRCKRYDDWPLNGKNL